MNRGTIIKILLSVIILGFIFYKAGLGQTFEELSQANLWFIPLCILIYLLSQWISSYRWQSLCKPLGFYLSLRELYDYYMMGMFFSLFLPGSIGGDVGRMYYLAKSQGRKKREALLTLLAERGVGLIGMVILTALACLTPEARPIPLSIRLGILSLAIIGITGFVFLQVFPIERLIQRFPKLGLLEQAQIYWQDYPLLMKSIGLSLIVHAGMILIHYLIAVALNVQVPLFYLVAVYGLVGLVSVIPIFFNGIGVREGAYQYLFSLLGIPAHTGLAFGLYWFLISTMTSLLGGLILLKGHYKTPPIGESSLI